MSMLFDLRQVSNEKLQSLLNDPSDIFFFLHGSEPYKPPESFFKRLFSPKTETPSVREWHPPEKGMRMELDNSWHVLHFLLCGKPWEGPLPQATLMCGGTELGSIDVGYGPARILNDTEVEAFINYLNSLTKETYASGITFKELEENEIYGAYPEWSEDEANTLWEYVEEMKIFFEKAKSENNGVILYCY